MIIGSNPPPQPTLWKFLGIPSLPSSAVPIMPQAPADLSDNDCRVLSELNLPQYKWNNRDAKLAIYNKTENYDVYSVQVSKPGMELSRSYILEHIEFLLKNSTHKTGGG